MTRLSQLQTNAEASVLSARIKALALFSERYPGLKISTLARALIAQRARSYSLNEAPVSPTPGLTGNRQPEISSLAWLRGKNKCNQFVGDALSYAGFEMPTFRMPDGSLHYAHAESLPKFRQHFRSISALGSLQAGDVLVLDWSKRSAENGAHVEIITDLNIKTGDVLAASARKNGASEKLYRGLLNNLSWNNQKQLWLKTNTASENPMLYFLRPIKHQD